jgi:hypothetical protein
VLSGLLALATAAVLLLVPYLRGRARRSAPAATEQSSTPGKLDTTLGDFHDMREALRPLEHKRAASRREPGSR